MIALVSDTCGVLDDIGDLMTNVNDSFGDCDFRGIFDGRDD
jgi:hypothetical protein